MRRLAAITGGTGFVGHHVLAAFAEAGWRLRMLSSRYPRLEIGDEPVELVPGRLEDEAALERLVTGADAIVHMAGLIKATGKPQFMAVNAEGTARLARFWARHAPAARFILLSSMAAREAGLSYYAVSKAAGEEEVKAVGGSFCILRPCAVYGPGDRETLSFFKTLALPVQPVLNGPQARFAMVHAADVASAILAAAENPDVAGTYEVTDERIEGYTWRETVETACRLYGKPARPFIVPPLLLHLAGGIADLRMALGGKAEMLTRQKVRELLHPDWSSRSENRLPAGIWKPKYTLEAGFAETLSWYRSMDLLPRSS